jgi:hypothetical protein
MNGLCFHTLGILIPTDELIFFRGVGIPPTSYSFFWGVWVKFVRGCLILLTHYHEDVQQHKALGGYLGSYHQT